MKKYSSVDSCIRFFTWSSRLDFILKYIMTFNLTTHVFRKIMLPQVYNLVGLPVNQQLLTVVKLWFVIVMKIKSLVRFGCWKSTITLHLGMCILRWTLYNFCDHIWLNVFWVKSTRSGLICKKNNTLTHYPIYLTRLFCHL